MNKEDAFLGTRVTEFADRTSFARPLMTAHLCFAIDACLFPVRPAKHNDTGSLLWFRVEVKICRAKVAVRPVRRQDSVALPDIGNFNLRNECTPLEGASGRGRIGRSVVILVLLAWLVKREIWLRLYFM